MKPIDFRGSMLLAAAAASLLLSASTSHAADKVRFLIDWAFQGQAAPFVIAADKGYFAAENLDVSIDRGYGSADAITKLASGTHDMAFGDINSMIEFNTKNPDKTQLIGVFMIFDKAPLSIFTLDETIKTPKDLEGKKIVTSQGEANLRLFPILAKLAGIDRNKVTFVNVQPQLRESLMLKGEGDAATGFYYVSYIGYKALNADMKKLKAFMYADYGLNAYSNAIIVPTSLTKSNPDLIRRFNRALAKGLRDSIQTPEIVAPFLKKRDGTIVEANEIERLKIINRDFVVTPYVVKNGFGDVDATRMTQGISQISEALELPRTPKIDEVFTNSFLPPLSERMPN